MSGKKYRRLEDAVIASRRQAQENEKDYRRSFHEESHLNCSLGSTPSASHNSIRIGEVLSTGGSSSRPKDPRSIFEMQRPPGVPFLPGSEKTEDGSTILTGPSTDPRSGRKRSNPADSRELKVPRKSKITIEDGFLNNKKLAASFIDSVYKFVRKRIGKNYGNSTTKFSKFIAAYNDFNKLYIYNLSINSFSELADMIDKFHFKQGKTRLKNRK